MNNQAINMDLVLKTAAGIILANFAIFSAPLYISGLIDGNALSESEAGLINTIEIAAIALTCLAISGGLARIPLRLLGFTGLCAILIGNVFGFINQDFSNLLWQRALAGLGAGLSLAVSSALLSRAANPDRLIGIVMCFNLAVMAPTLILIGFFKDSYEFTAIVAAQFTIAILLLPILAKLPATIESSEEGQTLLDVSGSSDSQIRIALLGISVVFLFCFIEGGIWAFSGQSGSRAGLSSAEIGVILSTAQGAGLLGAVIAAVFGQRLPRLIPISVGITLITMAGYLIYTSSSAEIYRYSVICFNFGFALGLPYLIGACAKLDDNGGWAARANAANLLGGAASPFLAGLWVTLYGYESLGFISLVVGLTCLTLAAIFSIKLSNVIGRQPALP